MYNKRFSFLLLFLLFTLALPAQITINGSVLAGGEGEQEIVPVPDYPVLIASPDTLEEWIVYTDADGNFSYSNDSAVTVAGDVWSAITFDPCGFPQLTVAIIIEEGINTYGANFNICADSHPPSSLDTCIASLSFQLPNFNSPTVQFFSTSTATQTTSFQWDFGDGQSSTEENPLHTYPDYGTYEVTLTITGDSCVATTAETIQLDSLPCDCDINFDIDICVIDEETGEIITFTDPCEALCSGFDYDDLFVCAADSICQADFAAFESPEDPFTLTFENTSFFFGALDSVFWDFGDGSFSTENNPTYTYQQAGTYQVQLTIFNENCFDTRTGSVTVGPSPSLDDCQAFFVFDQPDPENLLTYQFFGFSITGSVDSVLWDFGDGTTATESEPLHTYAVAGTYQVRFTIFSEIDCASTLGIVINVGDNIWYGTQECRASFLPLIIGDSTEVYFWNTSSSDAISYEWDFGDGNTSTEFEPFYVFPASAVYTVTLTTTTEDGCVNEYIVIIDLANNNFTSMPQFTLLNSTRATSPAAEDIQVFPNPSPATFTISWSSNLGSNSVKWQLIDISGRVIEQRKSLDNGRFQIDLGDRPAGVYFLRMESETGTTTQRLIKS